MSDTSARIDIGSIIEDRYEVVELLGEGGFGVVYRARQMSTGQDVAIKLLHPEKLVRTSDAESERERFRREMGLIAQLKHPNVVRLIDSGELGDGQLFTVLEFVDGRELNDLIDEEGPLELREAKRLMTQVLEALATAHNLGVVHRDLKPQNIMVTRSGRRRNAMVLDFGIATILEEARGESFVTLTQTGQVNGTPTYMAPEQLEGEVSVQSDIYAWGLVFCEAVSGRRAISADSVAGAIYQQLSQTPISIPDEVDHPRLREVLARAVEKEPSTRYENAENLLVDLESCVLVETGQMPRATGELDARAQQGRQSHQDHQGELDSAPGAVAFADTIDPDSMGQDGLGIEETLRDATRAAGTGDDDDPALLATAPVALADDAENAVDGADSSTSPMTSPDTGEVEQGSGDPAKAPSTSPMSVGGDGGGDGDEGRSSGRGHLVWLAAAVVVLLAGAVAIWWFVLRADEGDAAGTATCEEGQVSGEETDGHCCWPGQTWSGERCAGLPTECPEGLLVDAANQTCSLPPCEEGRVRVGDARHCCWPEQTWSTETSACVGEPACPDQFLATEETCIALDKETWPLSTSCEAGNLGPCVQLAIRLQRGRGIERNPGTAAQLLERACEGDNATGCYQLGVALLVGAGIERDRDRARELFEGACKDGQKNACFDLANLLLTEHDATANVRATKLLEKSCGAGNTRACDTLGSVQQYGRLGVPAAPAAAAESYARACKEGYVFSCTHLAWMLEQGVGRQADPKRAAALYRRACDAGEGLACNYLAEMIADGRGVDKNPEQVDALRKKACRDAWYGACPADMGRKPEATDTSSESDEE